MAKYKVGDRVRVKKFESRPIYWNTNGLMDHLMGQVVEIRGICHYGSYEIRDGKYAWHLKERDIEPINESVVIYRKGAEVIATDKCSGKTAKAKCAPDDTFDFETGARLAFDRLMGETKPKTEQKTKWYTGQIVCVKSLDNNYTVGKVYQVNDGKLIDDAGVTRPFYKRLSSPTSYNGCVWEFIKYKGGAEAQ